MTSPTCNRAHSTVFKSFTDHAACANCRDQLSRYPALHNFEQQTSVPKVYLILGLGALYFFLIFFNIAGEFLVNVAGFIIPGYYSLEALFSTNKSDDTQWLTYWVTFSFLTYVHGFSLTLHTRLDA